VLIFFERKVLMADCWWLVCSERKVVVADNPNERAVFLLQLQGCRSHFGVSFCSLLFFFKFILGTHRTATSGQFWFHQLS
jgi:hypothetical protein